MNNEPVCRVCGRVLENPNSIEKGIGPDCEAKFGTMENLVAHTESMKAEAVPDNFLPLTVVNQWVVEQGLPKSRLLRAAGGNRGFGEPIDPMFKLVYVGRRRYISNAVMSNAGLQLLKSITKGRPGKTDGPVRTHPQPKKPKPTKAKKVSKKPAETGNVIKL